MKELKVFVICNSDSLALPSVTKLMELDKLVGIGITQKAKRLLAPKIEALGTNKPLVVFEKSGWEAQFQELITTFRVDVVFALTFPWKVPASLLSLPTYGFVNFHFGLLPKYKGADPIFWQFKEMEEAGGVTIHLMNESIDEGPVILQEKLAIVPGENYGFHCMRLGNYNAELIERVLDWCDNGGQDYIDLEPTNKVIEHKPAEEDLTIDWNTMSAHEVEQLVNACNPTYVGARTNMGPTELRILEVTPVTFELQEEALPGHIVYADATYGILVACADRQCVRLTMAQTGEGYLSGVKLFNLGFTPGHRFGTIKPDQ